MYGLLEANEVGVKTVAVDFGYAPLEKLKEAGANHIISHYDELEDLPEVSFKLKTKNDFPKRGDQFYEDYNDDILLLDYLFSDSKPYDYGDQIVEVFHQKEGVNSAFGKYWIFPISSFNSSCKSSRSLLRRRPPFSIASLNVSLISSPSCSSC